VFPVPDPPSCGGNVVALSAELFGSARGARLNARSVYAETPSCGCLSSPAKTRHMPAIINWGPATFRAHPAFSAAESEISAYYILNRAWRSGPKRRPAICETS
jgi:hypothetical protein